MGCERQIKIALGQLEAKHGDPSANLKKMLAAIDAAAGEEADLVVFPELAYTGHLCPAAQMRQLAEPQDGRFVRALREKAEQRRIHVIAGYPEADGASDAPFNSLIFLDGRGSVIGNMRKVYLWGREKRVFRSGDGFPVFQTDFGKIGLLNCYDAEFPEPARLEALRGAELIVVCGIWSIDPAEHRWHVALQANAMFNLLFVAGCNAVGENICGSSMVVAPDGRERHLAPREGEALLIAPIDLSEVSETRERIPYWSDFKRETFSADAIGTEG